MRPLVILLFCVLMLAGCSQKGPETAPEEAIPVKVMKVELRDLFESLEYVGNIKAEDEVLVYPKVGGKIMRKVKEDNSPVNKGEAIVYIDRDEVGLKFEKAPVESPLDGVVGRVYVDIGSNVSPQDPVALVVNMDSMLIDLGLPEKYLPRVSLGKIAKIKVDAYPDREFSGKVTKFSPMVDLETRTAPIEITIDNQEGQLLKPGMFAKVNLFIEEYKNVPVILKEAVVGKEPDTYIYVIEDNKVLLKKVKLGVRQGPYYAVDDGIKPGDLVVIMGQQRLYENAKVSVETE
ncbi:MAG: efflux RND transporter periplasmic adaptor subunit [Candidatus Omnitrophica bacterium]|nr:efflux RND transporter periplasmic adaptor subunit [Candidatus Omnitrophota bacterium]